jgi:Kef-type K+ transport system membrane component KefB/nucleotide-binding universal stress UspA family protein
MSAEILVFVAVVIIIGFSRLVGLGFRRINQPLVIGEILAGIMLGPSLLGLVAPEWSAWLFPEEAIPLLHLLSDVGLIFFMFLIGLELDPKYLRGQIKVALFTSQMSIVLPLGMGILLATLLYPLLSNPDVSFGAFAFFLGSALSITAFPVLARIITENNLQRTRLGALALTAAAMNDFTAWCLLALAIAITRTNHVISALPTLVEALVYVGFMFTVGRRLLRQVSVAYNRSRRLTQLMLSIIYMTVLTSALITDLIGIHLIFGAFLVGAVMPRNPSLVRDVAQKTEEFVLVFLLPIFFAYSGLRTQIGLLNQPHLWFLCALILMVAIAGKYFGTYFAARCCGIGHRESSALGILMNTRGLTELILLNIGLSLGVISPVLFAMLVIMALTTTFMTSPLLEWVYPKSKQISTIEPEPEPTTSYRILVLIANPATQRGLVRLATAIALPLNASPVFSYAMVHPLSFIELDEDYAFESTPLEANRLIAQRQVHLEELVQNIEPAHLRRWIHPIALISSDVARETTRLVEAEQIDLVLMGWHRPALSANRLGGRVGQILSMVPTDVAVFIDNGRQTQIHRLLVTYAATSHDDLGLEIALRLLIHQPDCTLTILRVSPPGQVPINLSLGFLSLLDGLPANVRDRIQMPCIEALDPMQAVIGVSAQADLTIVGTSREWGIERQTLGHYTDELATYCQSSLLITRKYNRVTSHLTSILEAKSGV